MKYVQGLFRCGFVLIMLLFLVAGLALAGFSVAEVWTVINTTEQGSARARLNVILDSIGILTIAVAALELGQTLLEEEIQRNAHMSTPTRVRRFLSRFMLVVVVSLAIEFLVVVFELAHDDPTTLPAASSIGIATAVLLAGWGLFIRLNKHAEELEPEAMERAKQEDAKVD